MTADSDDDGECDTNHEKQSFDELLTISDKSALIPEQEPATQSWEELRTVHYLASYQALLLEQLFWFACKK